MPIPISDGDLARAEGVRREPMGSDASGAQLERLRLPDGTTLIRKALSPTLDWMMRATNDPGRAATLWTSGAMDRLPPVIDPVIRRIEHEGDEWRLYMADVDANFLRRGTIVDAGEARRFLEAFAAMHAAFWNRPVPDLCRLEDLIGLVALATIEREAGGHPFLEIVRSGWTAFDELVPDDIQVGVRAILAEPRPLADALRREGATLVHADPHYGNVAPGPDRFHVIDWSLASWGPPAVDFAWWLDQSAAFLGPDRADLIEMFRYAEGPRHTERGLDLAMLTELVLAGWQYADALIAPDADDRARRRADLDWWVARARVGLERLA